MSHSLIKNTKLTFPTDGLTFVLDYARHKGDIILSVLDDKIQKEEERKKTVISGKVK